MRRYDIYFGLVTNEAHSCCLVAIDAALSGAQITVAEMGISQRTLLGGVSGGQPKIPWCAVVEQKRRGEMKASPSRARDRWSSLKKTMPHEWGGHDAERDEMHARANMAPAERRTFACVCQEGIGPTKIGYAVLLVGANEYECQMPRV